MQILADEVSEWTQQCRDCDSLTTPTKTHWMCWTAVTTNNHNVISWTRSAWSDCKLSFAPFYFTVVQFSCYCNYYGKIFMRILSDCCPGIAHK